MHLSVAKESFMTTQAVAHSLITTHTCHDCMRKKVKSLSRVGLFATPRTVAYQAPPSMEFSRQDYWSGCHCLLLIPNKHWQILMKRILSSGLWEDCYHTVDTLIMFLLYWLHFRLVSLWWDLTSVPTEHIYMSPGESRGRRSLVGYSQIWLSD